MITANCHIVLPHQVTLMNAQLRQRKTYSLTPQLFCKFKFSVFSNPDSCQPLFTKNTIMKKTLWKSLCAFTILTLALSFKTYSAPDKDTLANTLITAAPEIQLQASITEFVNDYLEKNADMLDAVKLKNKSCFTTIEKIFAKQGIPVELKYLAIVESKLKNAALSGAGAAGIWQLMPATAKILGLRINGKTDERRYVYKSSVAAAKYLTELYKQFDDWLLVIAAYNSGAGTVFKAIKKSGSRDFWKLQNFLPRETRMHVKKFIATHYYYEEKGSLVTLTKAEREKHMDALNEFLLNKNETDKPAGLPVSNENYSTLVMITHNDNNTLKLIARK
jgi:membrane-bound lytic murein transglycosylase D